MSLTGTYVPNYAFFDRVFNSAITGLSTQYGTTHRNFVADMAVQEQNIVGVANKIAVRACTLYKKDIRQTF